MYLGVHTDEEGVEGRGVVTVGVVAIVWTGGCWRGITMGLEDEEDMWTAESKLCRRAGFRFRMFPPWREVRLFMALPTVLWAGLGVATAMDAGVWSAKGVGGGLADRVSLGREIFGKYLGEGILMIWISLSKNRVSSCTIDFDNR